MLCIPCTSVLCLLYASETPMIHPFLVHQETCRCHGLCLLFHPYQRHRSVILTSGMCVRATCVPEKCASLVVRGHAECVGRDECVWLQSGVRHSVRPSTLHFVVVAYRRSRRRWHPRDSEHNAYDAHSTCSSSSFLPSLRTNLRPAARIASTYSSFRLPMTWTAYMPGL